MTKGFTLVEVIISVAIASVIMSVVLWNYSAFNDQLALSSAAQEIAIAIRQAQTYGISARETGAGQGNFDSDYGVYLSLKEPNAYSIFVDTNANKVYDPGQGCGSGVQNTECVEKSMLRNGVVISAICDESGSCPPSSASQLDVTFLRPNPDATIDFADDSGFIVSGPSRAGTVVLTSPMGRTIRVEVDNTGEIVIK